MKEVIFQKTTVRKFQFYSWLTSLFLEAGWEEISSRPLDGQVFYSKGEDGKSELYINLKEFYGNSLSNGMSISSYSYLYHRPLDMYVPSSNKGSAGTFTPAGTYSYSYINDGTNANIKVHYYADKDRVVLFTIPVASTGTYCSFIFLGKPEYDAVGDITKKAVVCGSPLWDTPFCRTAFSDMNTTKNYMALTERMFEMPVGRASDGKLLVSELIFSDDGMVYGNLLKIPGVLTVGKDTQLMNNTSESFNECEFAIGEHQYKTIYLRSGGNGNISTNAMAFRVK